MRSSFGRLPWPTLAERREGSLSKARLSEIPRLYIKIDKVVWDHTHAVGKPFKGDLRQIVWEGLDVDTKGMVLQKGFGNFDYKALCEEIRERFDLLAPTDVVLAQTNDMVMGTSSFEPTLNLAAIYDPDMPETAQATE